MFRKLIFLILLFTSTVTGYAQSSGDYVSKNSEKDQIRRLSIRSKSVWEYYYVQGNEHAFRDSGYKSISYLYDRDGKLLEYTKYHVFSALTVKENYDYDILGRIVKNTRRNSNGDIIEAVDYKYTTKGYLRREIHSAYYNSVRVGVYFTITANVNENEIFSRLQDELQIEPKLESYMITVNINDPEELNQYVVIGDESQPTSMRFSWSQLSGETQSYLLGYQGTNKKEHSYINKFISEVVYKRDKNGNLAEKTVYNTAGDLIGRESYRYNQANQKINYYKYNENDKISSMETYFYDTYGRLIESVGLDPMGKTVGKLVYKYNDKGNIAEKLWMNSAGVINGRYVYIYDSENRMKEESKFRGENEFENRMVYNYDDNGNLLEVLRYDVNNSKERLLKYVYENY